MLSQTGSDDHSSLKNTSIDNNNSYYLIDIDHRNDGQLSLEK